MKHFYAEEQENPGGVGAWQFLVGAGKSVPDDDLV